jgi:mannose-1-phosphate guanylyltransferase
MQIIISCGGGGTRLWPVSTEEHPKQLIPLLDDQSLMLKTYNRIRLSFLPEQIWVTVNEKHLDLVKNILPSEFDSSHIITEPIKRDTFAAITLSSAIVASRTSKNEPLVFIPSDDWIESQNDINSLNLGLLNIGETLESGQFDFITVGIKPKSANTQLGYLEVENRQVKNGEVTKVKSFKEKPNQEVADEYFASGNFFWHKHNPSLTYTKLVENMKTHWPELVGVLEEVYEQGKFELKHYESFPKLSIDYAILEKAEKIGVLPLDINWNDVGTWDTVYNYLPNLNKENLIQVSGENNKVKLENPNLKVAFAGVSNLLVVQTSEGLLILDPTKSSLVKDISEHFKGK